MNTHNSSTHVSPAQIMQLGMGFMASRTLLSAVEFGLFTTLAKSGRNGMTCKELETQLGLHERASADFFDGLIALGMLGREGNGPRARYLNTPETAEFLDKASPKYIGGILEMAGARLFAHWNNLSEGLRTGKPQNEIKHAKPGDGLFEALYSDPVRLEGFLAAMAGVQMGNFMMLAEKFDFTKHGTVCDLGGASAAFSIAVARRHPQVSCISFDLPPVEPIARRNVERAGVAAQVTLQKGDFFKEAFPKANVIAMGNILHDWGLEDKKMLLRKAYEALPAGGCFIAVENVIDDDRRKNVLGLMMSLNMLIETNEGFDYTGAQFRTWCLEAGFRSTEILPLAGPASAAIAYK